MIYRIRHEFDVSAEKKDGILPKLQNSTSNSTLKHFSRVRFLSKSQFVPSPPLLPLKLTLRAE